MAENDEALNLRTALVESLHITDTALKAAFLAVPRHLFLPDEPLEKAYSDEVVPIKWDSDQTVLSSSSQPGMMAAMLHQLQVRPGHNVLEIGAGTGYNAALLRHLVGEKGHVTTIELDGDLVEQARRNLQRARVSGVQVVQADGALGYAPRAAFDRVIVTAGVWDVPAVWHKQLKPRESVLVAPIWLEAFQVSAAFIPQPDGTLLSTSNIPCGFIHLRGLAAGPGFSLPVNSSSLILALDDTSRLDAAAIHLLLSEDIEECHLGISLTARDYWRGLLPYLALHLPEEFTLAVYGVAASQQAYGLEGAGFALFSAGSASFIPYQGGGSVQCFAGSDAFMMLQSITSAWDAAGRPDSRRLNMHLVPLDDTTPPPVGGRVIPRKDHVLRVWLNP